jgi:hypothetical protein
MATLEELVVQLTAETSGLRAELANATKVTNKSMKDMEDAVRGFSENSGKDVSFFQTALATMTGFLGGQIVTSAFNTLKELAADVAGELIEGGKAAIAEEQAMTRLANSLAISGNYSRDAMKSMQDFAGEMERTTGVADDVVASNLAMLSSLTRLDAEGLKRAQKAALDFSAATGKDLDTATQMVAKAVNGSTDAFKKMGLSIEESTDKTVALNNVVGALEKQFGGAAVGAMKTFGGALTGATNAYGNFTEEIAKSVTQNPVVIAGLGEIANIFTELTNSANGASNELQTGIANTLLGIVEIAGVFASTMDTVIRGVTASVQGLVLGLNTVAGSLNWIADAVGLIDDNDPFKRMNDTAAALDQTVNGDSMLSKFSDSLAQIHGAGERAFQAIGKSAGEVKPTIDQVRGATEQLSNSLTLMYQEQLKSFSEGMAQKNLLLSEQIAFEQEQLVLQLETKEITEQEFMARRADNLAASQAAELAQLDAYYAQQKGKDAEYQAARVNLLANQKLAEQKMMADRFKMETEQNKLRQQNFGDTMNTIAQLSKSGNKELQLIGKAAAITQATIDGYAAVQKALASAPPPFNFALAAAVGVVSAMNISKIAGVGIGLNKGGTVPGGGANMDSVPASLTPGEEVVDRSTAEKLRSFLDGNGGGQTLHIAVSFQGATIIGDVRSSDFGAMVVEAVNEAVEAGKSNGIRGKTA